LQGLIFFAGTFFAATFFGVTFLQPPGGHFTAFFRAADLAWRDSRAERIDGAHLAQVLAMAAA
jgi:hypothetical protein